MSDLHRLIYVSHRAADCDAGAVRDILNGSRLRNRLFGVTGVLMVSMRGFCQVLEGRQEALEELLRRIRDDARHTSLLVLSLDVVPRRAFAEWEMLEVAVSDEELPLSEAAQGDAGGRLLALAQRLATSLY